MNRLFVFLVFLAGCESPVQQNPRMDALNRACFEGNLQACATAEQLEQQDRANRVAAYQAYVSNQQSTQIDPTLFINQRPQPLRTVCQNQFGVQIVCMSQ